jgi:transposase
MAVKKRGKAPSRRKSLKNYSKSGGMTKKGVAAYRKANPGSKLKTAVTGTVKKGSKDAKRRKSFCARMSGVKGPMKKPNGKPTRKALALRKWKC